MSEATLAAAVRAAEALRAAGVDAEAGVPGHGDNLRVRFHPSVGRVVSARVDEAGRQPRVVVRYSTGATMRQWVQPGVEWWAALVAGVALFARTRAETASRDAWGAAWGVLEARATRTLPEAPDAS